MTLCQALRGGAEASCMLLGSVEKVEFFFGGGEGKGLLGAVLDEIIGGGGDGVVVEFAKLQGDVIFDLIAGGGGSSGSSSGSSSSSMLKVISKTLEEAYQVI